MNKVEEIVDDQTASGVAVTLAPPLRLETGSLVTLRMQGHSRSPGGIEYYAPAVVLDQYSDDYGSIDALVWDSSAGNHYAHGYHIRELGVRGEGATRETYELQTNVGQVLFSPAAFVQMQQEIDILSTELHQKHRMMKDLLERVMKLEQRAPGNLAAANEAMPSAGTSAPKGADKQK